MKESVLIILKPDAMKSGLFADVLKKLDLETLKIISLKIITTTKDLAEEHYKDIKGQPFYDATIDYFTGKYHDVDQLIAFILSGEGAIKKCRETAGATNPEDAEKETIRGSYGRVIGDSIFENVVHVSASPEDTEREIKIWFEPSDIVEPLYETVLKEETINVRVWK